MEKTIQGNIWTWSEVHQAWLYGEPDNGAGVFMDLPYDSGWVFNVVYKDEIKVDYSGYKTKEEAMKEALEVLTELRSSDTLESEID